MMSSSHRMSRDEIPELKLNLIFNGQIASVKPYGAFVKIPGPARLNGLVHKSQVSKNRIDDVSEILHVGDNVWCKIISLGEDNAKISLSMKVVNQGTGEDLDPAGVQISQDEKKRREPVNFQHPKITLDAVYNTVCKKCGTKGHLAQNCFHTPGGKVYDVLDDEVNPEEPSPSVAHSSESPTERDKKRKRKHKKDHKESRHKKHKH